MEKKLFIILLLITINVQAQHLKIDNGLVISSFSNKKDFPVLDKKVTNYAVSIGLDYLEKDWFSLSSQIGYMLIGGEQALGYPSQAQSIDLKEQKSYIHLNTTFRPSVHAFGVIFFLGVGPTIDILADGNDADNIFYEGYMYKDVRIGGKGEFGIIQNINKFRFGIVGGYLYNLSTTAKSEFISLNNNAFSIALTTGYRIY